MIDRDLIGKKLFPKIGNHCRHNTLQVIFDNIKDECFKQSQSGKVVECTFELKNIICNLSTLTTMLTLEGFKVTTSITLLTVSWK